MIIFIALSGVNERWIVGWKHNDGGHEISTHEPADRSLAEEHRWEDQIDSTDQISNLHYNHIVPNGDNSQPILFEFFVAAHRRNYSLVAEEISTFIMQVVI